MSSARDQIVATTCQLLELQGYFATGLNQIIKESGSPKGSLYYYFPGGKEELAVASVQEAGEQVLVRIHAELSQIADPVEAISTFIMNVAQNVERSGFRAGGPITTIAIETASSSDRLREACEQIYTSWQREFAEKLTAGGFSPERSGRLARLIIAALEGGIILSRTSRSRNPLEESAAEIALLLQATRSLPATSQAADDR